MSEPANDTPELKRLSKKCNRILLEPGEHVLIVSSPAPEAQFSTALLCRAILETGGVFHVTFSEPVMELEMISQILESQPNCVPVLIGVDLDQKTTAKPPHERLIVVGSSSDKIGKVHALGDSTSLSAATYVLAKEKLAAGRAELQLAVQAALVGSRQQPKDPVVNELLQIGAASGISKGLKSFLVFGMNFLPAPQALQYSIRPYLEGFSGNPGQCERLIDEAGIPLFRRTSPLDQLTVDDKQKLMQNLVPKLAQKTITGVTGQDYEFPSEKTESPMRFLSQMSALSESAWSRRMLGLSIGVWIGDRARMLRQLIDSQISHAQSVISGLQAVSGEMGMASPSGSESVTVLRMPSLQKEILGDVAEILIEEGKSAGRFLMLCSIDHIGISWKGDSYDLKRVIRVLQEQKLSPVSASRSSVRIESKREETPQVAQSVLEEMAVAKHES